jgi:hypothetical protein
MKILPKAGVFGFSIGYLPVGDNYENILNIIDSQGEKSL